ncbi:MAG: aspartate--tRNA ligase [bacterium]|nr:aspartate--tRNA ligase [bacterium]MDZ4343341.1 aspartate--tRNA ligase [Candidatus Binatia bacterium]
MPEKPAITSNIYRTHTNGELTTDNIGDQVKLSGWVHARRDHGGLIFIDLRDRWGITQLTFDPSKNKDAWQTAENLRSEYVISVTGQVTARPAEMINNKLTTGAIEVAISDIKILSQADALPFEIADDQDVNEELRLQYRFLDLRRRRLQDIMQKRDAFITHIRRYMHERNFTEVTTPILANSSPEGARDYLVPSRLHPGKFYALPQAPQQFKQLLMVAGVDRYFQIAPCFRDEDPRADRHPGEFYQLDLEMSFVEQEDIFNLVEPLMIELTDKFSDKKITKQTFPRLTWREAMSRYGSDKPDLRYDLPLTDVTDTVTDSGFKVFADAVAGGGVVGALRIPGGAAFTRQQIDKLTEHAKQFGAAGLAYILIKDEPTSPIIKHLGEGITKQIIDTVKAQPGDAIFFGADKWLNASKVLGAIRIMCADILKLKKSDQAAWCWITDFPMYDWNEDEDKIDFSHNPFSMPQGGIEALNTKEPTAILAYQYDLVLNGFEISSGAIRNHEPATMYKAFAIAGYTQEEVDAKFGGMIRAFKFGAPPHGGIAPGIDRLMMALWELPSIRDIYAFPKNGKAQDVMMNAPSTVSQKQLDELSISVKEVAE